MYSSNKGIFVQRLYEFIHQLSWHRLKLAALHCTQDKWILGSGVSTKNLNRMLFKADIEIINDFTNFLYLRIYEFFKKLSLFIYSYVLIM